VTRGRKGAGGGENKENQRGGREKDWQVRTGAKTRKPTLKRRSGAQVTTKAVSTLDGIPTIWMTERGKRIKTDFSRNEKKELAPSQPNGGTKRGNTLITSPRGKSQTYPKEQKINGRERTYQKIRRIRPKKQTGAWAACAICGTIEQSADFQSLTGSRERGRRKRSPSKKEKEVEKRSSRTVVGSTEYVNVHGKGGGQKAQEKGKG